MKIEQISFRLSEAGLTHYVQESQNLEIEDLILQVCDRSRALQLARKVAHLDSRNLSINAQAILSQDKASNFRDKSGLLLELAAATCQIGSAAFGGSGANLVAGTWTAFGQGLHGAANYGERLMNARGQLIDFNSQRHGHLFNDYSQGVQSAEKEQEQAAVIADRIIQNSRRQQELVGGSA
jgi:hypothetical protein